MKRGHVVELALALALLAGTASAQLPAFDATKRPTCTDGRPWAVWLLNESSATDCDMTAGGTSEALCCCKEGSVAACASGGGGGSSNSFETIDLPSGTDPVADSGTDILAVTCAAPLTCTGNSGADSWAIGWSGTASKCARFDGAGVLVAASGDCSAGDTDTDTKVVFDIGDDGGNDSSGLTEIATLHDDYGVWPESSADKALFDFAKIPSYQQYDPNRPPSSCGTGGVCDEFTGGVTMTFNGWGNQESSTATAERDGLTLYHPTDSTGIAVYWFTGPAGSSGDWFFHTRISTIQFASFNQVGIALLATGTEASPTLFYYLTIGLGSPTFFARAATSYTSSSTVGTDRSSFGDDVYLSMGYVSSTKVLTFYTSRDGFLFNVHASTTLASHPTTSFGLAVLSSSASFPSYGFFHFVRVRTDTDRANPGE